MSGGLSDAELSPGRGPWSTATSSPPPSPPTRAPGAWGSSPRRRCRDAPSDRCPSSTTASCSASACLVSHAAASFSVVDMLLPPPHTPPSPATAPQFPKSNLNTHTHTCGQGLHLAVFFFFFLLPAAASCRWRAGVCVTHSCPLGVSLSTGRAVDLSL